jgi:hypothetical protein
MAPADSVLQGGYDFSFWFKSLAALGCPAPRVLAALRAATSDVQNQRCRCWRGPPTSVRPPRSASRPLRVAIGKARALTPIVLAGVGSYGAARGSELERRTSYGPVRRYSPLLSGQQRTSTRGFSGSAIVQARSGNQGGRRFKSCQPDRVMSRDTVGRCLGTSLHFVGCVVPLG